MQSSGLIIKKHEMVVVSLNQRMNEIHLEGYRVLPFLDFKEEEKEEAILTNLDRFFKTHKGGRDNLYVALPRDAVFMQFLHMPAAVEENLRESIGYEMDRHTPFSIEDVYYDCHVLSRMPESSLLYVLLVTVKKDTVDYYLNLLKKIKIKPRGMEISTSALYNIFQKWRFGAVQTVAKKNPGVKQQVLQSLRSVRGGGGADEPRETSDVAIAVEYLNDAYELSVISTGALCYSKVLSRRAPFQTAEHFQQIYDQGMKALIHLPYDRRQDHPVRVFLSGREMEQSELETAPEAIRPFFSVINNLPVKTGKKYEGATAAVLPLLSVSAGAALKGIGKVTLDVNLIPPELRPRKKRSRKKIVGVAAGILLIAYGSVFSIDRLVKMNAKLTLLNEQLRELKFQVKEIEGLQQEADRIKGFSEVIDTIRKNDVSKLKLLEELTLVIPLDSYLTDFQYEEDERKIKISGYAVSASKLIPLLEESKFFANVRFTSPITTDRKTNKERFRIEMSISAGIT